MAGHYNVTSFSAGNCYSYLLSDSGEALLVDPHITLVEKYVQTLKKKNLSLVGIVDTHTHADHISSAAILKKRYSVPLYMSERSQSAIATDRLHEGDVISFGRSQVKALYTPGHTDDSVSLISSGGDVFSGDVLLINSVGRTDFQNGSPEDMFDSLQKLSSLPGATVLRPAHDYKGRKTSTLAEQRQTNPFLLQKDKTMFCENARAKKMPKPANMDIIIASNQQGLAETFSTVSPGEASKRIASPDAIILDVREEAELKDISLAAGKVQHIPLNRVAGSLESLSREKDYYVLCRSGHRATMAAMVLTQNGFRRVSVIEGGITAWDKAGLPVRKIPVPLSLERQVRVIAGGLAGLGALLTFVNVWFALIPLWVGTGLVFAGLTDKCLMASLLLKMPYNKKAFSTAGGSCSMDGGCSADGGTCSM